MREEPRQVVPCAAVAVVQLLRAVILRTSLALNLRAWALRNIDACLVAYRIFRSDTDIKPYPYSTTAMAVFYSSIPADNDTSPAVSNLPMSVH